MTKCVAAVLVIVWAWGTAAASAAQASQPADLDVREAWVREAAEGQASTAAYFVIENRSAAAMTLVGVTSAAAATAELHTMQMQPTPPPSGMPSTIPMGRMMRMMQVDRVVVPAHGTVEFKPGGYHVMLFKVAKPLVVGQTVDLTLEFADRRTATVTAVIGSRAAVSAPQR